MYDCINCSNLIKVPKEVALVGTQECYLYGCRANKTKGTVCGWVFRDSELKDMGCTFWKKIEKKKRKKIKVEQIPLF